MYFNANKPTYKSVKSSPTKLIIEKKKEKDAKQHRSKNHHKKDKQATADGSNDPRAYPNKPEPITSQKNTPSPTPKLIPPAFVRQAPMEMKQALKQSCEKITEIVYPVYSMLHVNKKNSRQPFFTPRPRNL